MTPRTELLLQDSPLRVLSLFAGIGGIDLGLERAGMEIVAHCEIDPYASRVLAKHWPDIPNLGSVVDADFAAWAGRVDVIAGGFPCQDISYAGLGGGITEGTRSGLWYEYARSIRDIRPRYVIVENVSALLARGLDIVLGDLATLGYDSWWDCIPAASVGAPHLRDRVFVVATRADVAPFDTGRSPFEWSASLGAHAERISGERRRTPVDVAGSEGQACDKGGWGNAGRDAAGDLCATGADAHSDGRREQSSRERGASQGMGVERQHHAARLGGPDQRRASTANTDSERRQGRPPERRGQAPGARTSGGIEESARAPGDWWSAEPGVGRVAPRIPHRVDRLRCLGNAVVPQVAQYIGELVVAHHQRQRRRCDE